MERSTGPDKSKDTPAKPTSAPKGLDESLENARVARRELTTTLPPPAPVVAMSQTDFTTLIENALQDMPGVDATERIEASPSGDSGEITIEMEGGRIYRVTYAYDKRLSYDQQGECYNPESNPMNITEGTKFRSTEEMVCAAVEMDGDDDEPCLYSPAGTTWEVREVCPTGEVMIRCQETGGYHTATPAELKEEGFIAILPPPAFAATLERMSVMAEVHTDDYAIETKFNAEPYLAQLSDEELTTLVNCGWGGDFAADEVARFFEDSNPDIKAVLNYQNHQKDLGGFECHVDLEAGEAWLRKNRPHLALILLPY